MTHLKRGRCLVTTDRVIRYLRTEPSVWYRGRAVSCAFVLGWPVRKLLEVSSMGGFASVERRPSTTTKEVPS